MKQVKGFKGKLFRKLNGLVILLGSAGSGKTTLLEHYIDGDFNEFTETTTGVNFRTKKF